MNSVMAAAIENMVRLTGRQWYRDLCDPASPAYNPAVVRDVLAMYRPHPALSLPRVNPTPVGEVSQSDRGCGCGRA